MSKPITLKINGSSHELDVPAEMPLLWAIRDVVGLTGTKYGCGAGICGACTVLVNGVAERSCSIPVGEVEGAITTIEHVGAKDLHPVQKAWIAHNIPQCGYCQSGFIMQIIDLLTNSPELSDEDLMSSITNICRCGTYPRMPEAIAEARAALKTPTVLKTPTSAKKRGA